MAREARARSESRIYHVMLRGALKQDIFIDDEDKGKMLKILKEKKQDDAFFIYAYCLLSNHFHIVIREGKDDISRILKRTATCYASYFNKKYQKTGRVFQDRFKSEAVHDVGSILPLIRFVHQNPGRVEMERYPWSSLKEFTGQGDQLCDCSYVLDLLNKDRDKAIRNLLRYTREDGNEQYLDIAKEKEICTDNADEYIRSYLKARHVTLEDLKKTENRKIRDDIILYLLKCSSLSRRQIAEKLEINRETVRKAGLCQADAEGINNSVKVESA